MKAGRPRFVYLDMGNVIVHFDRGRALRNIAAVTGLAEEAIRRAVSASGLSERLERGEIGWATFHDVFSRATGTRTDPDALAHAYSDMFELSVGMLPVIAGLERAGCRLGLLSNTCGVHWDHIVRRSFGILPGRFEVIVLSHEEGCVKPERAIFEIAADRAGVGPEGIFFTDDLAEHVAAARRAGWDAERFTGPRDLAAALEARGVNLGM